MLSTHIKGKLKPSCIIKCLTEKCCRCLWGKTCYLSIYSITVLFRRCAPCRSVTVQLVTSRTACIYSPGSAVHFQRSVSSNPKSGRLSVLIVCCFFVWLSVNYGKLILKSRRERLRTPKKAQRITPHVQFSVPKRRESYRGQLGCREELVSAAPVCSCRDDRNLSRTKLSTVTRLDLSVVRLGNPSSNTNS